MALASRATLALAGEFARNEAGPARWENMHRALSRALTGVTVEHRRATLALNAAHHRAAEEGNSASSQLDVEIAADHLARVTEVRNGLVAVIREVRRLVLAAREQTTTNGAG